MHAKETHAGAKPFPGCFFSLCTTVCLLAAAADGAVRTWDGGGANGFWATPANWVGDIAPVSGDDLVFPPGAATLSNTNNFAAGFLFNSITISGGSYSLYGTNVLLNAGLNATNTTVPNFFFIPITLNSNQSITTGNSGVNLYLYGAINGNGKNLTFDGAGLALVNSAISGVGGLIKTGPGSADLYASNAFDGPVQILQGFSSIYDAHALGSTNANTTIASGTTLFLANSISLAEPLVLSGTLGSTGGSNTVTGPILLSVSNATVRTLPGGPLTLAGTISGTGGFSKIASDVLRLTANNTYSGTTALSAGTLLVNGNQPASPIVFGGGTLGGTGTVGTITPSGPFGRLLAPGVSPGILTCSNLTLDVLSAFAVEVNGTTPGTGYDQLEVHGTVSLGNALLSISNTIGVVAGQSFTIINNDGADPVAGTFSGLPEGAVLTTVGANQLRITYAGGTGNDVVLFVTTLAGSGGVAVWTNRYNGPANGADQASAMAVDVNGNVFVTGASPGSGSSNDYATVAYSAAGVPIWTNRYNGPGNDADLAHAIAVDTNGNVFVTGSSVGSGTIEDYATIKYSGAGVPLWTNRYNSPSNSWDSASAIVVDRNGNVIVTGSSLKAVGFYTDFVTIKYSNAGAPLWTNRYDGPGGQADDPAAVAVDQAGNVFVTGSSFGDNFINLDYATVAYSSAGVPLWTNRYNGSGSIDKPAGVAVDSLGNVIVSGYAGASGGNDYLTLKYSNDGIPLWTNRYNGPANSTDEAYGLALDSNDNIFVAGASWNGASFDYATLKYASNGPVLWTNYYDGPGHHEDWASSVAVDKGGNVFVTGYSQVAGVNYDYATLGYSGAGALLWINSYDGPGNGNDRATVARVDSSGNVIVTGFSLGSGGNFDYATIKYSSSLPSPAYLSFQRLDQQLVLSWTNAGFHLQAALLVTGTYTNISGATSPYTNSATGAQQFFRLTAQ